MVSLLYFAGPILRGKYPSTLKQSNALNILCCALFVRGEMFFCEAADHDDKDWKCSCFIFFLVFLSESRGWEDRFENDDDDNSISIRLGASGS